MYQSKNIMYKNKSKMYKKQNKIACSSKTYLTKIIQLKFINKLQLGIKIIHSYLKMS